MNQKEVPDLSGIDLSQPYSPKLEDTMELWIRLYQVNRLMYNVIRKDPLKDKTLSLPEINLAGANLRGTRLFGANLFNSNLNNADLSDADLAGATLSSSNMENANLRKATLTKASLVSTNLSGANLSDADLSGATLIDANLSSANLISTNLEGATLVNANMDYAVIKQAKVYGINVWDIKKHGIIQKDLIVTPGGIPNITVDDLEIAQFIYLILNNQKFRDVIETVTSKAVLILGRFTEDRKQVLDAIRNELRNRNFLPILFDFEKPATRDLTETISILAKLSRFVIADLTDAKSIPQELSHIVPNMPSLPVIPLILKGQREYGMFEHWPRYPWVLPIYEYENEGHLISTLSAGVIEPAERKVQEIRSK